MKTLKIKAAIIILVISLTQLSCSNDDDNNAPIIEELSTEFLDCSNPPAVPAGETLILVNRNSTVDYFIDCVFTVNGNLIIEPGVTIEFGSDAGIIVYGSIQAIGSAIDPIIFTGQNKTPGSWKGIYIQSNDNNNELTNTQINYAGGAPFNSNGDLGAIVIWSSTNVKISNTTITHSEAFGINASYGGSDLEFINNTITQCQAPMTIEGAYPTNISGGNFTGNTIDAIYVTDDQITGNHDWENLGVPYRITNRLVVAAGGKLTIAPGSILEFDLDGSLEIAEGASGTAPSLIAVGTALEPIIFTGVNKVLGSWQGIWFDSPSALNEIGFANIEYASNVNQEGAIWAWYHTVLNVHDVSFNDIQNCAIYYYRFIQDPMTIATSNLIYTNVDSTICEEN